MKTGAIIQARTGSTRLPDKVVKELPYNSGITVLQQVIRRLKQSRQLDEVIVATTTNPADAKIAELAESEGARAFRGSEEDVLSRYYLAATQFGLDLIARVTSDCPCADPAIVDFFMEKIIALKIDLVSNALERSYPYGYEIEAFTFQALEKAHKQAAEKDYREHVTLYIYNKPGIFTFKNLAASPEQYAPELRLTVDTQEDYALLCAVFDYLYEKDRFFGIGDVINLFKEKPWLELINKKTEHKKYPGQKHSR